MTTGTKEGGILTPVSTEAGPGTVGSHFVKTWYGANDPKRKAENPYSMLYVEKRDELMRTRSKADPVWFTCTWENTHGGIIYDELSFDSNDLAKLVNKLGASIKQHSFNAAVAVGAEGKEALTQVAEKTLSLYRGFKDLKRGNVQSALHRFGVSPNAAKKVGLHKDLSSRVLATQLGWIPLMSDIADAFDAVKALTNKKLHYSHNVFIKKKGFGRTSSGGVICGTETLSRRLHWTLSEQFSTLESLSLTNPWDYVDLVWNATTLSFIADWFIPIGQYLESRSIISSLTGSGYQTTWHDRRGHGLNSYLDFEVENGSNYFNRILSVDRVTLASLNGYVPLPTFKDFNKIPSWRRALTAVTLATQMFAK